MPNNDIRKEKLSIIISTVPNTVVVEEDSRAKPMLVVYIILHVLRLSNLINGPPSRRRL